MFPESAVAWNSEPSAIYKAGNLSKPSGKMPYGNTRSSRSIIYWLDTWRMFFMEMEAGNSEPFITLMEMVTTK